MEQKLSTASYAAAGVSILAGLTLTEWGVLVGIVTAVATFGLNWLYRHRSYKLEAARVAAEIRALRLPDRRHVDKPVLRNRRSASD